MIEDKNAGFSDSGNTNEDGIRRQDRLVDLKVLASLLGVCARTVHRLVAAGELPPPAKLGRASRWFASDVDQYMEKLKQARMKFMVPPEIRGAA
jgi:excisionase family DNA binding protein